MNSIEELAKKICYVISVCTDYLSISDLRRILKESIHAVDIDNELEKLKITFWDLIFYMKEHNMIGDIKDMYDLNKIKFKYVPSDANVEIFSKIAESLKRINKEDVEDNNSIYSSDINGASVNFLRLKMQDDKKFNKIHSTVETKKPIKRSLRNKDFRGNKIERPEVKQNCDNLLEKFKKLDDTYEGSRNIENNKFIMKNLLITRSNDSELIIDTPSKVSSINKHREPVTHNWFSHRPDVDKKLSSFEKQKSDDNSSIFISSMENRNDYESINNKDNSKWRILDEFGTKTNVDKFGDLIEKLSNSLNKSNSNISLISKCNSLPKKQYEEYHEESPSNSFDMYRYSWFNSRKNLPSKSVEQNCNEKKIHSNEKENNHNNVTITILPLTIKDEELIKITMEKFFGNEQFDAWH
uniref:Rho-GAP domain-containing protein n=1 Tax=Strongyloides papillosus TaxID=174720 RepID=A0A0N5BBY9_STREA